jgi:hypothetical protein
MCSATSLQPQYEFLDKTQKIKETKSWFLTKIELPYEPAIPLPGTHLEDCESGYSRDTALCTTAKRWKQPQCSTRKCGVYTQWNITQPQRRMNFVICRLMDGTGEHLK